MSSEADVIRLVQRADWTHLSLTVEMNDGSRVLLAPGRRYREQTLDGLRGCDGERPWRMPESDEDRDGHWIGGPEPPLPMLLCPAWLLRSSRLEGGAPVRAARCRGHRSRGLPRERPFRPAHRTRNRPLGLRAGC